MAKKILIVDDEPLIREMVSSRLKANGYETILADGGQEGLQKTRQEHPDLIILDVMMPTIDGYQVCAVIKQDVRYRNIPIILFTAKGGDEAERTGLEDCGADAFISKPFDAKALLQKIQELLKEDPNGSVAG